MKELDEVLNFCSEQDLLDRPFDEFKSIYNSYYDYEYKEYINE